MSELTKLSHQVRFAATRCAFEEEQVAVVASAISTKDYQYGLDDLEDDVLNGGDQADAKIKELQEWPPPKNDPKVPVLYYVTPDESPVWYVVRKKYDYLIPLLSQFESYSKANEFDTAIDKMSEVQGHFNTVGFNYTELLSQADYDDDGAKEKAKKELEEIEQNMGNVGGLSGTPDAYSGMLALVTDTKWTGGAARVFRQRYGYRLPVYVGNNLALATILRWSLEAQQALCGEVRSNAVALATKARDSLHAIYWRSGEGGADWSMTFTVIAAAASVGGVLPPPANAVCAIAAAGASVAASATVEEGKPAKKKFAGNTLDEILDSIHAAVEELNSGITETDELIAKSLDEAYELLTAGKVGGGGIEVGNDVVTSWREAYFEPKAPKLGAIEEGSAKDAVGKPY